MMHTAMFFLGIAVGCSLSTLVWLVIDYKIEKLKETDND